MSLDTEMGKEILARAVGRRKEAVAQIKVVAGTGDFIINNKSAKDCLHNNSCSLISIKAPFTALEKTEKKTALLKTPLKTPLKSPSLALSLNSTAPLKTPLKSPSLALSLNSFDLIITVRGGGLVGQAEAIKLGVARALCQMEALESESKKGPVQDEVRKQLKAKGYLTQDARVKERRKYGLKKARKASQYHKR